MRIVLFTNEYAHNKLPPTGGLGTFYKRLAEGLIKNGIEVHVLLISKRSMNFSIEGIQFEVVKSYAKSFPVKELMRSLGNRLGLSQSNKRFLISERIFWSNTLNSYVQKHGIDLVESFVYDGYTAYYSCPVPLVLRFHGSRKFWHYKLQQPQNAAYFEMEQLALESCTSLVANSIYTKNILTELYHLNASVLIYNGLDTSFFKPEKEVQRISKSIFYFGTLSASKGLMELVRIVNKVHQTHPDMSLHLIGRGKAYFDKKIKKSLSSSLLEQTTFYAEQDLSDLPRILSSADLILLPSRGETFGYTIVEAMSLEKTTIIPNIPVAQELIDHQKNGYIFDSEKHCVELINELFCNPEITTDIGKEARQKVVSKFSIDQMIRKSIELYNTLLNDK